ncbi:thioredoxin [uncultured Fusobacterium sp.]|uniref:thioredoxin n=1 Tax=uncultured Fusobacterium sp. TaxID=159267 RepID=UPI0025F3CF01|nr:thioredoxin [uncultured Fusobacterium sp.]MCF2639034.1 thioredoxin [Fusobacterium varium]
MSGLINLNEITFQEKVIEGKGKVIVDFWAEWCGPCKLLSPILEEVSNILDMKIYKVNVDENPSLAGQFGIKSIPTIVIFDDGVRVKEVVGLRPKEEIIEKLTVY